MNRRGAPYLLHASLARRQQEASLTTSQETEQRAPLALCAVSIALPPDVQVPLVVRAARA
jgi:hypothetical protein